MSEENIEETQNDQDQLNSAYEKILHKKDDVSIDDESVEEIAGNKEIKASSNKEKSIKDNDFEPETKEVDKKPEATQKAKEEKKERVDSNPKFKELEERFNEAKKWGQSRNRALLNTKRKVSEFVTKLNEDGVLPEEDVQNILSGFNVNDDEAEEEIEEEKKIVNPFVVVKEKLDNEFATFKRYNRGSDLEAKYEAFYSFFPMMSDSEQEEAFNYLQDAEPDIALDYIMTNGDELYNNIFKGAKEKGGVLKYIKSLKTKLDKLEKKSSELESELDVTTKKVYSKVTDSQAEPLEKKANTTEEFYSRMFQR